MTEAREYGRREFLQKLGLGVAGAAIYKQLPLLERIAEAGEPKRVPVKSMEAIFNDIGNKIADGIPKWGMSSSGYRNAYKSLNDAIEAAQEHSRNLGWDEQDMLRLKGFEVNAYMHQSNILRHAGNNVITKERIVVKDLIDEYVTSKINNGNTTYNFFKALANYQRVLDIWEEAKKHGKELPYSVNHRKLGDNNSKVARPDLVYQRMIQTINSLLGVAPDKYHVALKAKKAQIEKRLDKI